MLADAVFSELYRFARNRPAVIWSTLFVPVIGLIISIGANLFLKQKMDVLTDARLPPGMINGGPLDMGQALVELAGSLANPMVLLFLLIGAATIYAGDYRWETWRLISARNTRPNLILGKVGVVKLLTLAALIVMLLLGVVGELVKGGIFDRSLTFHFGSGEFGRFVGLFLVSYVRVVQVTLLGLLAAVLTRSLLATLFVPLVVSVAQFFLMQTMPLMGWQGTDWYALGAAPGLAYDTLKDAILATASATMPAPPQATVWIAGISLLAWCLIPLIAAILWFNRQDLSKE